MKDKGDNSKLEFKSRTNCCVPQCSAFHSKNPELSYHTFPKSNLARLEWLRVLRIGKKLGPSARVCSRHFKTADFRPSGRVNRRLLVGAVPSRNLPVVSCIKQKSANQRAAKKARCARHLKMELASPGALPAEANGDSALDDLQGAEDTLQQQTREGDQDENFNDPVPVRDPAVTSAAVIFVESIGVQVNTFLDASMQLPSVLDLIKSDSSLRIATGIENFDIFKAIVKCCKLKAKGSQRDMERNVLLTMMKLKHDMYSILAVLFKLSVPAVASLFTSTVTLLGICLKSVLYWPSVDEVRRNMPKCFSKFQKTRVVLDCTEFPIECTKCLRCRLLSYSHYKGQNTVKVMIGVSPAGLITMLSVPWGGRASDKTIFQNSELINLLEPYLDGVMVDKGFHIDLDLQRNGIELFRPPFLRKKAQFSKLEAEMTAEIASARVHVERVIGRLKTFKVLNGKIKWRLLPYMNSILHTICGITNLCRPVLSNDRFL